MNRNADDNPLLRLQETRTLLWFLGEEMDGLGRSGRWGIIKRRLGLKKMSCCGASWGGFRPTTMSVREDGDEDADGARARAQAQPHSTPQAQDESGPAASPRIISRGRSCAGEALPASPRMNLATALAAERQMRAAQDVTAVGPADGETSAGCAPGTPLRVSLLRLLEESDGGDAETEKERGAGGDHMCCVCMGRKKGAAFIPCGHTFCRVCSRELWLNRGSCPLCNRSILEILDIF